MTTEEKLNRFSQDAIMLATKQHDAELEEYENNLNKLFESHTKSSRRQAAARIKLTREGLVRERNRRLSMQRLEAKHKLSEAEADLKDKLFDQVSDMINEYRQKPAYTDYIISLIGKARQQAGTNRLCIFLDKADEALIPVLNARCGLPIQVTQEPIKGGILAMPESGNLLIDLSYSRTMSEVYDTLKFGGEA